MERRVSPRKSNGHCPWTQVYTDVHMCTQMYTGVHRCTEHLQWSMESIGVFWVVFWAALLLISFGTTYRLLEKQSSKSDHFAFVHKPSHFFSPIYLCLFLRPFYFVNSRGDSRAPVSYGGWWCVLLILCTKSLWDSYYVLLQCFSTMCFYNMLL